MTAQTMAADSSGDAHAEEPPARGGRTTGSDLLARIGAAAARRQVALVGLGVTFLSLLPRLLTVGNFFHYDESTWARRSARFSDAVLAGDFADASSASVPGSADGSTMPGVTTMWIGSLARGLWALGRDWGLWAQDGAGFVRTTSGLTVAQATYAVAVSVLLGIVTILVARWAGLGAALIAGVLMATEPFLVANGSLLHTDELVMLLGLGSLVATALVLGLPGRTSWAGRPSAAAVAGILGGAALLTKLSALAVLVGVPIMGVWAAVRAGNRPAGGAPRGGQASTPGTVPGDGAGDGTEPAGEGLPAGSGDEPALPVRSVLGAGGWWVLSALATIFVAYPALWVAPLAELENLWSSAQLAGGGHRQLFLGERTRNPGPLYLFVSLPLRVTPWFLVGGLAATVLVWRRATRQHAWLLLCMGLPTFVIVSLASKQLVRYGLPVLATGAIAVGVVAASLAPALLRSDRARRLARWTTAGATALVALYAVALAPWAAAYFNPLLGGASVAERATTIGSGEGLPEAGAFIEDREAGRCDEVVIWTYPVGHAFPCGSIITSQDPERFQEADYVALYINQRQRQDPDLLAELVAGRDLIERVTIRGIEHVQIYGPLRAPPTVDPADREDAG